VIDPLIGVRAVHIAATVIAAGTVFFQFFVASPVLQADLSRGSTFERWLTGIVGCNLAIAFASGVTWLLLLGADIGCEPIADAFADGTVATILTDTRFGRVLILRFGFGALLALTLYRSSTSGWRGWLPVLSAASLLGAMAWPGHAGATPGWAGTTYLAADVVHLIAAGAWLGGLVPFAVLLSFARTSLDHNWAVSTVNATRRFSILGILSVGALLTTGLVATWNLAGSVQGLIATNYGRLLLLKILLFAGMIFIASINRFRITPKLPAFDALRSLRRNSMVEIGLGLCIVVIVGALGTMPPASHSHTHATNLAFSIPPDAAFIHIHGEKAMAEVMISPGRVGPVTIQLLLMREDFSPLAAKDVDLLITKPGTVSETISRQAIRLTDGNWKVNDVTIPQPGIWTLQIAIQINDGDRVVLDERIAIEP
jgi:putative copper resistance protein D